MTKPAIKFCFTPIKIKWVFPHFAGPGSPMPCRSCCVAGEGRRLLGWAWKGPLGFPEVLWSGHFLLAGSWEVHSS